MRKTVLFTTFLFLIAGTPLFAQNEPNGAAVASGRKAIFIVVDGIPADVIESTATPWIDAISNEGAYTRAYVGGEVGGESQSPTVSAVGYQSLITGTWANKHNIFNNSPDAVNYDYWDIFRIAKNADAGFSTALFSTWLDNRTVLIGDGLEQAGGKKIDYAFDGFENDLERFPHDDAKNYIRNIDELVSQEAARYIRSHGPHLSWVYLQHTDDVGHRHGDSPELRDAVEWTDAQLGKIWQAVQERILATGEQWLIIVTTDHGRDEATGKSHGRQSPRERETWIATNAKELEDSFYSKPGIVDILPSITTHLGISLPDVIAAQLDGRSFISR